MLRLARGRFASEFVSGGGVHGAWFNVLAPGDVRGNAQSYDKAITRHRRLQRCALAIQGVEHRAVRIADHGRVGIPACVRYSAARTWNATVPHQNSKSFLFLFFKKEKSLSSF
jgi:hypothetical protein